VTPEKYEALIAERVLKCMSGHARTVTKCKNIMEALEPLLDEYHDLRQQNAGLLRVLRGQSGAFRTLDSLPPDESPG